MDKRGGEVKGEEKQEQEWYSAITTLLNKSNEMK
jgi:hypothetical protein